MKSLILLKTSRLKASKRNRSSVKGALLVELSVASFFLAVFVMFAVHIGLLIFGAFLNDRACRDAARSAAQGSSAQQSLTFAQAVLVAHRQSSNSYIGSPILQKPIVYQDFGGSPPSAAISPYVSLTTTTTVNLPIPSINFLAQLFTEDRNLSFVSTYTFPIVRVN